MNPFLKLEKWSHALFRAIPLAALAGFIPAATAQIVIYDEWGYFDEFFVKPAVTEWSTGSIAGAAGDITTSTQMDTAMAALTAGAINSTLEEQAGNGARQLAYWRSGDERLGTQPTGNKMTLLMAKLENATGLSKGSLEISYDLQTSIAPSEQINGHRLYWSKTGAANSWTAVGTFAPTGTTSTIIRTSIQFPSGWADGESLYLVWADDNTSGTQGAFTIDNIEIYPGNPTPEMLSMSIGSLGTATIGPISNYRSFVTLSVPAGTNITNLSPTYTTSFGAIGDPVSGTARDFTQPVEYTIYSSDYFESTTYFVMVIVQDPIAVGVSGSAIQKFDKMPATAAWSTLSVPGAAGEVTSSGGMDTAMSGITGSSISNQIPVYAGSAMGTAFWRSTDLKLGTQPTGNKMTLLKASLKNTSGTILGGVKVAYDFGAIAAPSEQINGHRVYWSKTGAAGSWTAFGDVTRTATGSSAVEFDLEIADGLNPNDNLYIVWADDNGTGTQGAFTLDNVTFTPLDRLANILTFKVGTQPATISGNEIRMVAAPGVNIASLAPTYTLSYGATCDIPSGATRDFSNPVLYTVTSAGGQITKVYTVTIVSSYWTQGVLSEFFDYSVGYGSLPDLTGRAPDLTRTDAQINYPSTGGTWTGLPSSMADTFGSRHTGAIKIDVAGDYTFFLDSDDGSKMWLNDELKINNDGLHGMQERSITLNLAVGYHPFRVEFFENGGGAGLIMRWQGPNIAKDVIPATAFYTLGAATITTATTLTSSINPSTAGQNVTFTATLKRGSNTVTDATGTYAFSRDGTVMGVVPLTNGVASYTTNSLPSGSLKIEAAYSGNSTYRPSTGTLTQVHRIPVNLTVNSGTGSATNLFPGDVVTVTANLPGIDKAFSRWEITSGQPVIADPLSASTTVTMGYTNATITAVYRDVPPGGVTALAWYDAADASSFTLNNGFVVQWKDKSGNNHHAGQTTSSLRPTRTNQGVVFGTNDVHLKLPKMSADARTVIIVAKNNAVVNQGSGGQFLLSFADNYYAGMGVANATAAYRDEVVTVMDATVAYDYKVAQSFSSTTFSLPNTPHSYSFVLEGANWHIGVDGSANLQNTFLGTRGPLIFSQVESGIGANIRAITSIEREWTGLISEIVIVSGALTQGERQRVEGHLAHKWDTIYGGTALVSALPANHPWKASPPGNNTPPVAIAQSVTTTAGTAKAVTLTGNDPNGNSLSYSVVTQPSHGTLSGTAPNLTYTPTFGYYGSDSFTFKVNDGLVDSPIATVSITVEKGDPYQAWATHFGYNLPGGRDADQDGDGLTNFTEFAFGLNPTSGTSSNPIVVPYNRTNHTLSYRRYAYSGLTYSVWASTDLAYWGVSPLAVSENAGTPDANGIQTVQVTLLSPPPHTTLFLRVKAEE